MVRIKFLVTIFTIFLIMSFSVSSFSATTYYVSSSFGSDSNNGTSTDTPWAHAPGMTNVEGVPASTTLVAGDQILFKRGDTWSEIRLTPGQSGNADTDAGRIYYGGYGSGEKPVINGTSNQSFNIDGKSYLKFENLQVTSAKENGFYIRNSSYIRIASCDITGIWLGNALQHIISTTCGHIYYNHCIIHDNNPYSGVGSDRTGGSNYIDDVVFEDCQIYRNGSNNLSVPYHNVYVVYTTNWVFRRCIVRDSPSTPGTMASNGFNLRLYISNFLIEQCEIYNNSDGIYLETGSMTVRNCLIHDNRTNGIGSTTGPGPIYIYNNTFVNNGTNAGYTGHGIAMGSGASGWVIKNNTGLQNINVVSTSNNAPLYVNGTTEVSNSTFDYNDWLFVGGSGPVKLSSNVITFSSWQGRTGSPDVHGMSSDPLFITNYTDLHLKSTSPCIDKGVDVKLPYIGTAPDLGAYEYDPVGSPPKPPVGLKVLSP